MNKTAGLLIVGVVSFAGWARGVAMPASVENGLPAFALANVAAGDLGKGWGEAAKDGAVVYRTATKEGSRTFKVKAWWDAKRLRPPEDTIYLLTVTYKDTASSPVVFYAYGGLGRDLSEVHRFGGTGDGQWKQAAVPVGWDNLCRLPDDPEKTSFAIAAEADLPVASIAMRLATKADEARYNAETRAWVAAVQAKAARPVSLPLEPPKFKAPDSGMVAFPWPVARILRPNDQPVTERIGAPIRIRMCLNQIEDGSLGVFANTDLKGVDYQVGELKGATGALQAEIVRRTAEYCLIKGNTWFPQRLWPAYAVDVPKGRSQWFVFNVKTRRGQARPGLYKGEVTVTADGAKAVLPVEVEVLPVDLLTMDEAGLSMGGCMAGLVPLHDIAFQAAYNQNGNNLWFSSVSPDMALKDGKLTINWAAMDEWLLGAKKRGMTSFVWFLGGDPYGFPRTLHFQRRMYELVATSSGKSTAQAQEDFTQKMCSPEFREKVLPEIRPWCVEFFRQLYAHAMEAAWPEVIVTPFDEPAKYARSPHKRNPDELGSGPWIKPQFMENCAIIREGAPKLKIYASIHHNKADEGIVFLPDVDIFCANCIQEDPALGDKVRAGGKTFWQYSGVNNLPASARYGFGFYFASFDSRGSLCWAYNWGSRFDTASGGETWIYAWQTPFDTIPAPYFEGMREAWDDRRIVETYKKTFAGDPAALGELAKVLDAARASYSAGGQDTVTDFWERMDRPEKLDGWRNQLLDRLVKGKP